MAEDSNNVKKELRPASNLAATFARVTSVACFVVAALATRGAINEFQNKETGAGIARLMTALATGTAATAVWQITDTATNAIKFTERVEQALAVNQALDKGAAR